MFDLSTLPDIKGKYKFKEPMKNHTWLNAGGCAEVMFLPEDEEDLQFFLQNVDKTIPLFMLGGGSNLLVRDGGFDGIIIKLENKSFAKIRIEKDLIYCGAGLKNAALKNFLIENHAGGLEFVCSIPGTIGGLVRSNAGCFGAELCDVLISAKIIDGSGNIFEVEPQDLHFSYRKSDFPADWIVLELCLKTKNCPPGDIAKMIDEQALYRHTHQPQGVRTAGSTFKNPPEHRAWELIKAVGGDALKIGGAHFSAQHCNFLINDGTATAENIEKLGKIVIERVKTQKNINLEWEIKIIGKQK